VDDQNCCPSRDRDGLCYLSIVVTQKGPAAADVDAGNDKKCLWVMVFKIASAGGGVKSMMTIDLPSE
jgi:hypothetical protein